jgi:flagellar protein FlaJ
MAFTKSNLMGIIFAIVIIIVSLILLYTEVIDSKTFYFVLGIAVVIAGMPFFVNLLLESKNEASIDQMFLEFSRDLVEGVRAGSPISKSIANIKNKNYGSLSPHVVKLANQISLGIPVKDALNVFAKEINSPVISRAISLIREAERSGGKIEVILESVSYSISQVEKLKKERKAAIYNLTVQGYIIFFIFIIIMLIMEFKILPMTENLNLETGIGDLGAGTTGFGVEKTNSGKFSSSDFTRPFLFLIIAQGFFAGLVIGKISEGSVKGGLKHSFILVAVAWLIATGANVFLNY